MDVATVLEEYLADVMGLPSDISFLLDEIKAKDVRLREVERRVQQKDGAIQKFVKSHGSLTEAPKEHQTVSKIKQEYVESIQIQQEKQRLATLGLYLVTKQVRRLQEQCDKLEAEGLLAPAAHNSSEEETAAGSVSSRRRDTSVQLKAPSNNNRSVSESPQPAIKRDLKRKREKTPNAPSIAALESAAAALDVPARTSGPLILGITTDGEMPSKRARMGVETVYCVCRQPSHGNMVACDADDCEFEWFHWDCVGLTEQPTGTWFCPQCREKRGITV